MRKLFLFLGFTFVLSQLIFSQENPTLVEIPHEVFVNKGANNFDKILIQNQSIKEKVKKLHAFDELGHELTVRTNTFEEYWKTNTESCYLFKLKKDKLLFFWFKAINSK